MPATASCYRTSWLLLGSSIKKLSVILKTADFSARYYPTAMHRPTGKVSGDTCCCSDSNIMPRAPGFQTKYRKQNIKVAKCRTRVDSKLQNIVSPVAKCRKRRTSKTQKLVLYISERQNILCERSVLKY